MEALEEARSLKDQAFQQRPVDAPAPTFDQDPSSEPHSEPPRVELDYRPSVEPSSAVEAHDEAHDDEVEEKAAPVESRYSRNSARLPRIGVDASSASSTIADLRKQMTVDD